jgi:hypothetical protein
MRIEIKYEDIKEKIYKEAVEFLEKDNEKSIFNSIEYLNNEVC